MPPPSSILIPLYNSEKKVRTTVQTLIQTLDRLKADYEILLRDDGSLDGTAGLLGEIAAQSSSVKISRNGRNRGLGFTLRQMIRDARYEYLIYSDCDLPFTADVIPQLVQELYDHDVVVCSRYLGARNPTRLARKVMSRFYYLFCKILFNVPVRDIGSGTVALRKSAVEKLDLRSDGFDIHVELFVKAKRRGLRIKEIAVPSMDKGEGSFRIIRHGTEVVLKTFQWWVLLLQKNA